MIIAHIVKLFATRIAVFVKSLTEAMHNSMHVILHEKRKKEMAYAEHRSIDPLKGLFAMAEIYMLRRLKQKRFVDTVHLHSSKNGLPGVMYVFKPLTNPGYFTLNSQIKAEMAA